ncbi:MAG: hypothetical protein K8S25_07130 [Alphaproteobacteria bacterium]|nr:hypothetical protein [Alphaproteobacteria bacterium]
MRNFVFAAFCLLSVPGAALAAANPPPNPGQAVRIEGYADEAMEPFISRDGRFLFFNTRNDPGENTNIHFAELTGTDFVYRGILQGTISYALDGTPTMSADGKFCFVSPRDYRRALISTYCGTFDGKRVNNAEPTTTLPGERLGRLIFDVELSADGKSLLFAEGTFSGGDVPDSADLYFATPGPRGFVRSPDSAKIFAAVNTDELEYAPALSADGLELYFTRLTGIPLFKSPKLFRARRASVDEPFGKPQKLETLEGFVEGPSLAPDGTLYFHKRVNDRYEIWRVRP